MYCVSERNAISAVFPVDCNALNFTATKANPECKSPYEMWYGRTSPSPFLFLSLEIKRNVVSTICLACRATSALADMEVWLLARREWKRLASESALRQVQSCVDELPQSLAANIDVESQDYAACIEEAGRLLKTFEDEQRDRLTAPMKFDQSLRMRPEDEARINPIGYIVELGYVEMVLRVAAGAPSKLVPFQEDANIFHSLSATNQTSMSANDEVARHARQLVETTFRLSPATGRGTDSVEFYHTTSRKEIYTWG